MNANKGRRHNGRKIILRERNGELRRPVCDGQNILRGLRR
jgi:hypothetical protein